MAVVEVENSTLEERARAVVWMINPSSELKVILSPVS